MPKSLGRPSWLTYGIILFSFTLVLICIKRIYICTRFFSTFSKRDLLVYFKIDLPNESIGYGIGVELWAR